MTSRAYIGEVLIQIHEEMSELYIRQTSECIKREFEKTSGVHESSRKPTKKVCDENGRRKKRLPRKIFCGNLKALIRLYQKNG